MSCEEKVRSQAYREFLIDYGINGLGGIGGAADSCLVPVDADISILYFLPENEEDMEIDRYPYYSVPKCYGLMRQEEIAGAQPFDPLSLIDCGILQVQGEPLYLTGQGVVLGFLDTGIRYTQAVFQNEDGGSRILAIWDQTLHDGEAPQGFYYGTEYSREQIDEALRSEDPRKVVPSWDTDGHGTVMASVAAGSSLEGGRSFTGAAPGADIVVVKLREAKRYLRDYYILPEGAAAYAETDIILGVKYLESYARALGRPVVICLGIGTNYGSHTGSSILDRYLDTISDRRSRAVVVCGGNEGEAGHHYENVSSVEEQEIELRVGEGERGFLLEVWAEGPNRYEMSLRTPGGERIGGISGSVRQTMEYRFVLDKTLLTVNSFLLEEASGRTLLLFRFRNPTPGVWTLSIRARVAFAGGRYHMWLPITAFMQSDTYFLRPDPYVTLTEPSMTRGVITVTTYEDMDGSFYERSGRGFSADRRIKPEFTAPGVNISTSLGKRTGSSLAAALAAGAAAQMMQWAVVERNYPLASGRELKYYLALGAVRSGDIEYPNREWGLGKINVQRTFQELAGLF